MGARKEIIELKDMIRALEQRLYKAEREYESLSSRFEALNDFTSKVMEMVTPREEKKQGGISDVPFAPQHDFMNFFGS